ncbi:MAG TPA: sigma-70 family RNA polymerase sigma factor [Thermoanaerobaculia bacterium]|nr:sigma-70 family RNA polymerase sigma factor [Thermoanaerobaculia bacterium]
MAESSRREALFAEILGAEGPALRRAANLYERDPARAEDLFQEICLALWRGLPSFRGEATLRTFAFRIAHNRGMSHAARGARRRQGGASAEIGLAAEVPDPAPTPEAALGLSERAARLRQAMAALPLGLRQVMTLTLEGLAPAEIGAVLGITENNVAVRANRARERLRAALGAAGGGR